jgi:hypothetical protein
VCLGFSTNHTTVKSVHAEDIVLKRMVFRPGELNVEALHTKILTKQILEQQALVVGSTVGGLSSVEK